ncbi:NAD(P)/FAD-dependent oxidoreductase [Bacillus sp. FJAT-45037]|uniref:NAD(P)/FAD-dependent oxidoreductase n=1 Tax=Bacillus sp. FJAT-45037 TaxID=2011007 RepID=UPI000C243483|nr:FAD-dependent oxidoreductase [Bacillus sp. FJAT-45037]
MKRYIIVGGGILGASTAYHLAKEGRDVTVIERNDRGQATEAAAGIVCPWLTQRRNKAWYQLAKGGAKYYPSLIQELEDLGEGDTGYERVGAIGLHSDSSKLDKMEERAHKRLQEAPEIGKITRLNHEETKKLFPLLAEGYEAVHVSGAARVNGQALKKALLSAAVKLGATIHYGEASLLHDGKKVHGVRFRGKDLEGDKVILTTGAWANELLEPLGIHFKIKPQKAQIIHLEFANLDVGSWPVVMPPTNQYLLSFNDGRVVIGATHEDDVGFDLRPTVGGMYEILDKALAVAPGLSDATVVETKVGFRPVAPNFLPIIGDVPNWGGLVVANGLGSSGLTVGPFLGAELAKLASGENLEIDLAHYNVAQAIEPLENVEKKFNQK